MKWAWRQTWKLVVQLVPPGWGQRQSEQGRARTLMQLVLPELQQG